MFLVVGELFVIFLCPKYVSLSKDKKGIKKQHMQTWKYSIFSKVISSNNAKKENIYQRKTFVCQSSFVYYTSEREGVFITALWFLITIFLFYFITQCRPRKWWWEERHLPTQYRSFQSIIQKCWKVLKGYRQQVKTLAGK